MSQLDLKHFVNVNIQKHEESIVSGTRGTVVLFTGSEGSSTLDSYADTYEKAITILGNGATNSQKYARIFFSCGGSKLHLKYGTPTKTIIEGLPKDEIMIALASNTETASTMKDLADSLDGYGIDEKILFGRISSVPSDSLDSNNLAIKYSTYIGAEMTIAAYLSRVNVYGSDTVKDYCYTVEKKIVDGATTIFDGQTNIDDSNYETLIEANVNFDTILAGENRNLGGNLTDGNDIINTFCRLVLHHTLTERLINLLSQKLKGSYGISKIYTAVCQELDLYRESGYLTTDKIWTDDPQTVVKNGVKYTLINRGDALTNGYIVRVLPFESLSAEEKAARKAPKVYVYIADQYGIRSIDISGEVI